MDRLVTVFGGSGFLGRYVVQELLRAGARVRVAARDPKGAWFLKPLGGLGQTQFVGVDARSGDSVRRAAAGSDALINLVGVLVGDFEALHVDAARNVAAAAAECAAALVHVSAIGADPQAESAYGRTKGEGEAAVRDACPAATIIRPSILFGPEDNFVNRFAQMARVAPFLPVIRAAARFQPAYVGDVARAITLAATDPKTHAGKTYELGGPQVLTMEELNRWIAHEIGRDPAILPIPDAAGRALARFGGWAPGAPITWDQWLMLQKDNVASEGVEGFGAFGIAPVPLAAVAPGWLVRFRRHGRFDKRTAA